jgi:Double zinc ribbon
VRCPSCGYENPQSTKFCGSCGAALKNQCVKCNSENPPEFKFCGECGASLTAPSPRRERRRPTEQGTRAKRVSVAPPSTPVSANVAEGERKTVTALFADIKGSTELTRDLDPEPRTRANFEHFSRECTSSETAWRMMQSGANCSP